MRFKQFELRQLYNTAMSEKYELVKWHEDNSSCFVIAFIELKHDSNEWYFDACGVRYLVYREEGLEEWLLKWIELKGVERKYE